VLPPARSVRTRRVRVRRQDYRRRPGAPAPQALSAALCFASAKARKNHAGTSPITRDSGRKGRRRPDGAAERRRTEPILTSGSARVDTVQFEWRHDMTAEVANLQEVQPDVKDHSWSVSTSRHLLGRQRKEWNMAGWNDLAAYVRSHYKIAHEQPDMITLLFEVDDLRSQAVLLWHLTLADGSEEWVQIESAIGELGSFDLSRALREIGQTVCGGLATMGELVTFRHAVPLLNLNINEFERPLALVTTTADHLERTLTGADQY
jgi:hypothetical protein